MSLKYISLCALFLVDMFGVTSARSIEPLSGPYFGQEPPGDTPVIFAPDIVKADRTSFHGSITFSPDGDEIYWYFIGGSSKGSKVMFSRTENGRWTEPSVADFSIKYDASAPEFSADGRKLFFNSNRPWPKEWGGQPADDYIGSHKIWYIEQTPKGWGEPEILDRRVNLNLQTVTSCFNGTIYTGGLRRSRLVGGEYQELERLGAPLDGFPIRGGGPQIAPDESYLIFPGRWADTVSGSGIFISFKNAAGQFGEPINLSEKLGMVRGGSEPRISPDGKYLFFYRPENNGFGGGIYWVDCSIINELRPDRE